MSEFGIRLNAAADPDEIARITGLPAHSVRRDLAQGFLARGLTRGTAERMAAELKTAGVEATVQAQPADEPPRIDPLRTQQGFAAIAPPKVTQPIQGAPPRAAPNAPPPFRSTSVPIDRRPPARRAAGKATAPQRKRVTQPVHNQMRLTPPTLMPAPTPPSRTPWIIAGALIVLSGVLVAWAWSGRDVAINALRKAEKAYAKKDYAGARIAADRAARAGAEPWASRLQAAIKAGPRVDAAEARLTQGDVRGAQQDLIAARAIAPDDRRTLQLIVRMREAQALIAAPASLRATPTRAVPSNREPVRVVPPAPRTVARPVPSSMVPPSAAPTPPSDAPKSAAPKSAAPPSATPPSAAPLSAASVPPVKPAYPPTRGAKDRSTVARLKVVCDTPGEILVNGKATRQLVGGWIEVKPGRHKLSIRDGNGRVFGLRKVKVAAGRRATVRLRDN